MDPIIFEQSRRGMQSLARTLGIAALVCAIILYSFPFLAFGLGALAVLLAILSKTPAKHLGKEYKVAISTGIAAMVISTFVVISVIYALKTNEEYRNNVIKFMEAFYSQNYSSAEADSLNEALNSLLGE